MARYLRFSDKQKALLWERWRQGDSIRSIARLLKREPASVFKVLRRTGGMQPTPRSRCARALSLDEREAISRGLACGNSFRLIARELNRAPATICREVERNGGRARYRATLADHAAWGRAKAEIGQFIEEIYNAKRLHSALGYLSPVEFEKACQDDAGRPLENENCH